MSYLGSKAASGVFQAICALIPPHDFYLEVFGGTAKILREKGPAAHSVVIERDPRQAARLRRELAGLAKVIEGDGLAYLAALDVTNLGRVVLYADPPYPLSTRTSSKRYRCEFTEADHLALAAALSRLAQAGCAVIVSTYPSRLYDALYAGWNSRDMQAMTRGGVRTERVYFNFEPGAVHWATFAGKDFTDRQRIKRKAASWARRYLECPPAERLAILAAMLAAERA
jgi:16S rRNA G966 N2-methylase RsmD